uniref:Uncharacterized protein n=1 Tax=Triticum urartu TaxID=4572 RepID=A0A8R7U5B6_TRIUA
LKDLVARHETPPPDLTRRRDSSQDPAADSSARCRAARRLNASTPAISSVILDFSPVPTAWVLVGMAGCLHLGIQSSVLCCRLTQLVRLPSRSNKRWIHFSQALWMNEFLSGCRC